MKYLPTLLLPLFICCDEVPPPEPFKFNRLTQKEVTVRLDTFVFTDDEFGYTIYVEQGSKILHEQDVYIPPCPRDIEKQAITEPNRDHL